MAVHLTFPARKLAVGLVLTSSFAVLWIATGRPTLGVAGQHAYAYRTAPHWGAVPLLLLLASPTLALLLLVLRRDEAWAAQRQCLLLGAITISSLALHIGTASAPKLAAGAEAVWPFLNRHAEGAYSRLAPQAQGAAQFLAGYDDTLAASARDGHRLHVDTHPPGLILAFVGLERFYDSSPSLERGMQHWAAWAFPSASIIAREGEFRVRHPLAVALTTAHVTVLLAALVPLAGYLVVRQFWAAQPALVAAALLALVPGAHLFSPSADQTYPFVTLVLCAVGARAVMTLRWAWGAAFGLLLYIAAFVNIALGLVAVIVALVAVAAWRVHCPERRAAELARAVAPVVGAALLGFLVPSAVLWLALGYPTFRVIGLCLRNNTDFYAQQGRTWWPWVIVSPFEQALSFGFALVLAAAAGWVLDVRRIVRRRSLRGICPLLWVPATVMVALNLVGVGRGETARLYLLLGPLLVLGVVAYLWRQAERPSGLIAALAVAQVVQVIVLSIALDMTLTSYFIVTLLRSG